MRGRGGSGFHVLFMISTSHITEVVTVLKTKSGCAKWDMVEALLLNLKFSF